MRIELTFQLRQSCVLPLNYTCIVASASGFEPEQTVLETVVLPLHYADILWYPQRDLNSQLPVCRTGTLPVELYGHIVVELMGIEPTTFSLQSYCSPVELQPHKQGTREISLTVKTLKFAVCAFKWSSREDLNLQPDDYKSTALPIVLRKHMWCPIRDLNPEENNWV